MNDRGNIVIYQTKDGKTSIDVKLEDETSTHMVSKVVILS